MTIESWMIDWLQPKYADMNLHHLWYISEITNIEEEDLFWMTTRDAEIWPRITHKQFCQLSYLAFSNDRTEEFIFFSKYFKVPDRFVSRVTESELIHLLLINRYPVWFVAEEPWFHHRKISHLETLETTTELVKRGYLKPYSLQLSTMGLDLLKEFIYTVRNSTDCRRFTTLHKSEMSEYDVEEAEVARNSCGGHNEAEASDQDGNGYHSESEERSSVLWSCENPESDQG